MDEKERQAIIWEKLRRVSENITRRAKEQEERWQQIRLEMKSFHRGM
jgi:hypothetical protein